MGCCLGTATTKNKSSKTNPYVVPPPNHHRHFPTPEPDFGAPPLPPPLQQEETVKEVLLETPVAKPPTSAANDSEKRRNQNQKQPIVQGVGTVETTAVIKPAGDVISEISDVSEMCSFSETLSTVTEKREDDGEVTQLVQRPPKRIPRKRPIPGAGGTEKGVRSPARRSEPSPVKRTSARTLQGRTMTTTRRNLGPPNAVRRDPGESSGRRSRSPVTRGEARAAGPPVRYKSPTLTPTGRSGGRIPVPQLEKGSEGEKPDEQAETNESLENPLVALECFIFL